MSDISATLEEGMDMLKDVPRSLSSTLSSSDRSDAVVQQSFQNAAYASLFVLIAWHYPRHLIHSETNIANKTPPYQETQAGDVILDFNLMNPVADPPTIPSRLLMWTSVWIPLLILLAHSYMKNKKGPQRLVHVATALGGFATAIGISEGTTVLLKLWIQRPRPNYYSLCGFDKALRKCTADVEHIREANFSFPSGHSSLTNCGMTFLVLYSIGRQACKGQHVSIPFNVILPCGWAIFVAASRLVDKWHHPSDVVAGLALGFVTSTIAYHTWYPPLWSKMAGVPRSLSVVNTNDGGMNKLASFTE